MRHLRDKDQANTVSAIPDTPVEMHNGGHQLTHVFLAPPRLFLREISDRIEMLTGKES